MTSGKSSYQSKVPGKRNQNSLSFSDIFGKFPSHQGLKIWAIALRLVRSSFNGVYCDGTLSLDSTVKE